jgi:amino-acid N-acetyltransferase
LLDAMTADEVEEMLKGAEWLSSDIRRYLPCSVRASRAGVGRVHLISFEQDGALLRELFTHDGVGTVVTRESLENIREAKPDDIAALIALIEPMEQEGILVHRPRELLEREVEHFSIMLHDGIIVGCAALYPHSEEEAELACLAVSQEHREWGYGEQLMKRIERRARKMGVKRLCVLPRGPSTGLSSAASRWVRSTICRLKNAICTTISGVPRCCSKRFDGVSGRIVT